MSDIPISLHVQCAYVKVSTTMFSVQIQSNVYVNPNAGSRSIEKSRFRSLHMKTRQGSRIAWGLVRLSTPPPPRQALSTVTKKWVNLGRSFWCFFMIFWAGFDISGTQLQPHPLGLAPVCVRVQLTKMQPYSCGIYLPSVTLDLPSNGMCGLKLYCGSRTYPCVLNT